GVIGGLSGAQHGHDGGSEQGIELFHHFIPCVWLVLRCYRLLLLSTMTASKITLALAIIW
ncbi:MAG: hypothetical protein ACRCWL_01270, partial [Aeromonas sp.]